MVDKEKFVAFRPRLHQTRKFLQTEEGDIHSRKRLHEEGEKEGIQTEEAGTEQGGTGGDTDGKEVDMIMTYTKPNQPDPKVKNKCSKTGH